MIGEVFFYMNGQFDLGVVLYIYYRFIVHFLIVLDFLFITFSLHFFLLWTSSLSISSSAMSASTLCNHVLLGLPIGLLPSTLNSIHFFHPVITLPSIPSQSTTPNDSCDRLNSSQPSQFFICPSVCHGDTTHPSNHLHLCSFKL